MRLICRGDRLSEVTSRKASLAKAVSVISWTSAYNTHTHRYTYDLVPKGLHENRIKGVENKVDDTLKVVVFLECAQC